MLLQAHGLEKISVYEGKERKSESVLEDIVIDRLLCDITQLGYKCEIEKKKILFILRMKLDLERILLSKQNY